MSDNAEYDRLVNDRASAERQLSNAIWTRDAIQEKIDRLITAKQTLGNCYDSYSDISRAVKSDVRGSYEWKGSQYDDFSEIGGALISANRTYNDNIDEARDAINIEIARLENEIYRQDGIIGQLRSLINSLVHRIENFFND